MKNIFIISGPSGAGEDSIIDALPKYFPTERIITTTTRKMRLGESQGNPYYFITKDEFQDKIDRRGFVEFAQEYNDNFYGVTHEEIDRVAKSKKIGIWKIEYKGVITAKKLFPEIVAIFINAPLDILESRIRRRDNVTDEFIKERLDYTKEWLKHRHIYDYEIINEEGKLDKAIEDVANIIRNEIEKSGLILDEK